MHLPDAPARPGPITTATGVVFGSAAIAVAAQVRVPMVPVPMTLQTFAVCAIAIVLGARVALLAALGYLAAAWCEAPVLSGFASFDGGLFASRTAGYVLGFAPAGWALGRAAERGLLREPLRLAVAALLAHALILAIGAAWLAVHTGPAAAVEHGVVPFVPGALAKSALAAALGPLAAWRRRRAG